MDAFVTVMFKFENICSEEDLTRCNMTLSDMTKYLIKEEGLFGVVDTENYKIVNVEEV
jgi:hypothetical protein